MNPAAYVVGQKFRITKDIYEPPDEYAPGGYLAMKGDTVVVRKCTGYRVYPIAVSHENRDGPETFLAAPDEVEPLP